MAGAADDDLYNKKIRASVAAEKKKQRLAGAARRKAEPLAAPPPAPPQLPAVIADPSDSLHPSIDPNGPVPPIQPMPDVGAPMPPQSFLQDQKDQQDAMDIIVLLATNPETSRLLAPA